MNNLNIKFKELPEMILGFFTKINDIEYIVLNSKSEMKLQTFAYLGCMYYKKQGSVIGKITIADIEKQGFEPIEYAKNKLKEYFKE
jgi:hypothetical protein